MYKNNGKNIKQLFLVNIILLFLILTLMIRTRIILTSKILTSTILTHNFKSFQKAGAQNILKFDLKMADIFTLSVDWFGLVSLFNGISTFVDYLMPNPFS